MDDPVITNNSRERAVTTNHFDRGRRYAYRITADHLLELQIDSEGWTSLALPPGVQITNVAADNNRVLVRTSEGKLYWRCLRDDSANWVVLLLRLAELLGGTPYREAIWKQMVDDHDYMTWIEDTHFTNLELWASAYLEWVPVTHDPGRAAPPPNRPYLKENGWNSLEHRLLPAGYDIDDIAVGHWNNTVVTYYVLAHSTTAGRRTTKLFFLDEEPIMHLWEAVPEQEKLLLDGTTRISASHSVVAAITGSKRPYRLQWMRIDAHRPGHVDVWPLNWTESWSDAPLAHLDLLRSPFSPGQDLPMQPQDEVQRVLLALPPFDVLNKDNYPGWHSASVDIETVSGFIIDVGYPSGPWPVPKPALFPRFPILNLLQVFSVLWWINVLMTTYSAAIDAIRKKPGGKDVGFLGENPIKPNSAYPVCCIVQGGSRVRAFAIPDASKTATIEWKDALVCRDPRAAPAVGDIFGYVTPFDNRARVLYRGLLGSVHQLSLPPGGRWAQADLTQLAGAPPAAGDASGYVTPFDNTARVVYRGLPGFIHELYLPPGGRWTHTDLTELAGAPPAAGDPFAYLTPFDKTARVLYRGGLLVGPVRELYLGPGGRWTQADLTQLAGAPLAAGTPSAYVTPDGTARVVYTAADRSIHELYLQAGGRWTHADLTRLAGAPPAAGDAYGYATPFDTTARVIYRGLSGAVHELYLAAGGHWTHSDLTQLAGAPVAAGDPFGYVTPFDSTARVLYRGGLLMGPVHELYLAPGGHWTHADLTQLAGAPPAAGNVFAYVTRFDDAARVLYREGLLEGPVHELSLQRGGRWTSTILPP
ncbi:MAG: hypothetical protein ACJ79H_12035 [Myxococcales bacterium]